MVVSTLYGCLISPVRQTHLETCGAFPNVDSNNILETRRIV